jgi:Tol biopolymer transport system component
VVPLAGGESRELLRLKKSEGFPWDLAWTRDGGHIVFGKASTNLNHQKVELWKISILGGEPQKLDLSMDALQFVRIHPDGQRIAFDAGGYSNEIWVMENFLPALRAAK